MLDAHLVKCIEYDSWKYALRVRTKFEKRFARGHEAIKFGVQSSLVIHAEPALVQLQGALILFLFYTATFAGRFQMAQLCHLYWIHSQTHCVIARSG
jgi:hypothetical protein